MTTDIEKLAQHMREAETPRWLNGEPYYCAICGAGLGEYQACEMPDCRLETREDARKRALATSGGGNG